MKASLKISSIAIITPLFAACSNGDKAKKASDSTSVKVDSSITTVIDSNKIKADSIYKDTASSYADTVKKGK